MTDKFKIFLISLFEIFKTYQLLTFFNVFHCFFLNFQTVSSADLKILDIIERWSGASYDQTIFSASNLKMRFDTGYFGRYIIVGHSGYANTSFLATPYTINHPGLETNPIIITLNTYYNQYLFKSNSRVIYKTIFCVPQ